MAAECGEKFGQFMFGVCLKESDDAVKYFDLAAKQWSPFRKYGLICGTCLYNSECVGTEYSEFVNVYKHFADHGNSYAQYIYGHCLRFGSGISRRLSQNVRLAAGYYKLSADQGNSAGQCRYGACLEEGIGVVKNLREAVRYYKLSADQGNSTGQGLYQQLQNKLRS